MTCPSIGEPPEIAFFAACAAAAVGDRLKIAGFLSTPFGGLEGRYMSAILLTGSVLSDAIEPSEDGLLVCKILRKLSVGDSTDGLELSTNLGFVTLPSRQLATFASIRKAIDSDLDDDVFPSDSRGRKKWKFYVPKLGPVSIKQEEKIGGVLEFLKSTTDDVQLGTGIAADPLKVVITV